MISHWMSENGVATLSFDKRGVEVDSNGYIRATADDFLMDADSAVNFLASRPEVDKNRIGILGHSEGALIGERTALGNKHVRGLILMASPSVRMFPDLASEQIETLRSFSRWDPGVIESCQESLQRIRDHLLRGRMWLDFEGQRLYLGILNSYFHWPDPLNIVRQLKIPVLLMHGREDRIVLLHHSYNLNLALHQGKNIRTSMVVFTDTGHFFGNFIKPENSFPYRRYIKPHNLVKKTLLEWLSRWYYINPN